MNIEAYALYKSGSDPQLFGSLPAGKDEGFSGILGSSLRGAGAAAGTENILESLRSRFPGIAFGEGDAEAGIAGLKKYFGSSGAGTDQVVISTGMLAGMAASSTLTNAVEETVGDLLEDGRIQLMGLSGIGWDLRTGALVISMAGVRYAEFSHSAETGELLAAAEFSSPLQERLAEMIRRFFGNEKEDAVPEPEKAEETAAADTGKEQLPSFFAGAWSMEVYISFSFSASFVSSGSGLVNAGAMSAFWQSAGLSGIQNGLSGILAAFLSGSAGTAGGGSGGKESLFSFMEELLAGLGLSGSVSEDAFGMSLKMRESRSALDDLMALYSSRSIGAPAAPAAEPAADAAAGTDASEAPAAAE